MCRLVRDGGMGDVAALFFDCGIVCVCMCVCVCVCVGWWGLGADGRRAHTHNP